MVTTTADEKLQSAKDHIEAAVKDVAEIVIDKCWGHDDFSPSYRKKINDFFDDLRELGRKIEEDL